MSVRLSTAKAARLFGAHVCRRAHDDANARRSSRAREVGCLAVAAHRLGKAEVEDLDAPSGVILMLAGFRSRWMIPLSWATSSASAI